MFLNLDTQPWKCPSELCLLDKGWHARYHIQRSPVWTEGTRIEARQCCLYYWVWYECKYRWYVGIWWIHGIPVICNAIVIQTFSPHQQPQICLEWSSFLSRNIFSEYSLIHQYIKVTTSVIKRIKLKWWWMCVGKSIDWSKLHSEIAYGEVLFLACHLHYQGKKGPENQFTEYKIVIC